MVAGPRHAELNEALALPLSMRVICLLLGVPVEDCDQLRRSMDGFLSFTKMRPEEAARWRQDLWKYVGGFIESKRTNPGSDLVSDLIRVRDGGDDRINDHELHFWVQGLLIAGYTFTSSQITTGTAVLLHHRYLVDEIQQNWSLVPSAVEELLRTQIAVPSTANLVYATEDIELDGYTIRKGASVVLSMESANVDETVFDNPFTINIRRKENHHMTFGGGLHYCVGAALARMELQVSTETLLRRFPKIHLAVPAERLPRSVGSWKASPRFRSNGEDRRSTTSVATGVPGTRGGGMSGGRSSARAPENQVTSAAIMELGMAFCGAKTLLSAVELGVFSELAATSPLDTQTLRERLGLHPRGARDFFDALVALGMLERKEDRYANTPATEIFLDRAKPSYLGEILEMANTRLYRVWGSLTEGLRTGLPQNDVKDGTNLFDVLYADPATMAQFARTMTATSAEAAHAITAKFPWHEHHSVIDIGCAEGVSRCRSPWPMSTSPVVVSTSPRSSRSSMPTSRASAWVIG